MANVKVFNMQGAAVGEIALSDQVFGVEPHIPAMHAVVRAYMNAQRQGTQSALTRTEVRGGGRKIYRQKGTGNARHHGRRDLPTANRSGIHPKCLLLPPYLAAKMPDNLPGKGNIRNIRAVMQNIRAAKRNRSSHHRQHRIFCSAD